MLKRRSAALLPLLLLWGSASAQTGVTILSAGQTSSFLNGKNKPANTVKGRPVKAFRVNDKAGTSTFLLTEQVVAISRYGGDSLTGLNAKGEVYKYYQQPGADTIKNLYAYCFAAAADSNKLKFTFQDAGNPVYSPAFNLPYTQAADADQDGFTEYYLVYFGYSDGLDAKPLKILVYDHFKKYKITAFYPAGNPGDKYRIAYGENWNSLPESIRRFAGGILQQIKKSGIYTQE